MSQASHSAAYRNCLAMTPTDARARLEELPFAWRSTKARDVMISWNGRTVTTLRGKAAERFLAKIAELDDTAAQHVMARATGNFKHGNEQNQV